MDHQNLIWSLGALILGNILGIWRVTASQNKRFDDKFIAAERHVNNAFAKVTDQYNGLTNQITAILQGDIRELRNNLLRQDENMETIRLKASDSDKMMNTLVLKVDRLERTREDLDRLNNRKNH